MSQTSSGTIKLVGNSVITTSYTSGSTITCKSDPAYGAYTGTSRIYKTYFDYHEQDWLSSEGGEMVKIVPKNWDGYLNKYDYYEPMCTPAHIGDAYSQGYITVQGGQSKSVSATSGLTFGGALTLTSSFIGSYKFIIDATYTSSTTSALTRTFTTDYNNYLVYPQSTQRYVISN